jgi:agmatine/peptidylarginine deiminase
VLKSLAVLMRPNISPTGRFRAAFARLFSTEPADSPVLNLQCFFAAMDVLASTSLTRSEIDADQLAIDYFAALRELQATAREQQDILSKLGWKIVPIPSMPDLYRSLNYLNGLHNRASYLMPAIGGFYRGLDDAAEQAFKAALGDQVAIIRIPSQEIQRHHGGLHCVASAYPLPTGAPAAPGQF